MPRQGCENLRHTVKSWGRGSNCSTLPLRGKQDERPWQIFGFYSERKRRASSVREKKERKKKKKSMDVLKQRQEQFYTLLKAYLGVVLTPPGLRFFFFLSKLKEELG